MAAQPVELILARNLVSGIELAAFLVDRDGVIVFFNDAAGDLIGRRFEEVGRLVREEWAERFGPFDEFGELMPIEDLPSTQAMNDGLPRHGAVHVRRDEELLRVEVSALPLTTSEGFQGAIVVFWRSDDDEGG